MKRISSMTGFALLLILNTACGQTGQHQSEGDEQATDASHMQLINFQSNIVEREAWLLPDLSFTDRQQCEHGINLYNSLHPEIALPNPYTQIGVEAESFLLESHEKLYYYSMQPSRLNQVKFELSYTSSGEESSAQQVSLSCPIPLDWYLKIYHDAKIVFPQALKTFASQALTNPQTIGIGAKGGFGFQYLDSIGHEVFLTWSLVPFATKKEQILAQIVARYPFIVEQQITTEETDLIKSEINDPLAILAFIDDNATQQVDSLFVKHLPSFQGDLHLSPYFRDFADVFDYDVEDTFESMLINGSAAISALRNISYPSLQASPCRYEAPITSAENCYTFNKRYIFSKFEKLFNERSPGNPQVCVLAHYQSNLSNRNGLSKLICIDRHGRHDLRYNGIHKYVNEAISQIQAQSNLLL